MIPANQQFGQNEEQIVRFIDHELTPEEERALMDECATDDGLRGMLKQHVSLSRGLAATLAGVTVPAAAEESLAAELAALRAAQPAASATGMFARNAIVSAIAGLTVVGFMTVAYLSPKPAAPVPQAVVTPAPTAVAPPPAAPVIAETPVAPPKAVSIHRRAAHRVAVATQTKEPVQMANAPQDGKQKKGRRIEQLTPQNKVKE